MIHRSHRPPAAGTKQDRRALLKAMLGGGAALARLFAGPLAQAATTPKEQAAQNAFDRATRGMPMPRIKDISVIQVGGGGVNDSTVVKVTTDQAGLYGFGCATATFPGGRAKLVTAAVTEYLQPLLQGRTTDRIEQLWQLCYMSSYYKNDTVLNCAIGGVCDALWGGLWYRSARSTTSATMSLTSVASPPRAKSPPSSRTTR